MVKHWTSGIIIPIVITGCSSLKDERVNVCIFHACCTFGRVPYNLWHIYFHLFKWLIIFPHPIIISLCESSAKVENLVQKRVLMELDFGTKFTLHLWFTLGVRGIFGQLLVSLESPLFCDYFVELLREWWCQNQTSKHYRANRFYDCF